MSLVTKIYNENCLDTMSVMSDCFVDLIFTDPPYGLGSKIIIRPDGKPDYAKASDFMDKWDMPTGKFWETWFAEAFRVLKFGGHCLMFGMDRQLLIYKYYANLAGFNENQSLYWYQAQSFPKSSDLSKNLDKHFKADRKVVGKYKLPNGSDWNLKQAEDSTVEHSKPSFTSSGVRTLDITAPTTDLAKKYSGYKYSIAPLKQTNETILVFQKPYKTGSCMHDILAMESGDKIITCGALDIDGGRVPTKDKLGGGGQKRDTMDGIKDWDRPWRHDEEKVQNHIDSVNESVRKGEELGRYPSQVFCNDESAELIDKQSGVSKSAGGRIGNKDGALNRLGKTGFTHEYVKGNPGFGDVGGASKILHKCNFEPEELGDKTITCGALNIDGGRVPTNDELGRMQKSSPLPSEYGFNDNSMGGKFQGGSDLGRYPAQTFCNSDASEILDNQSGERPSGKSNNNAETGVSGNATPLRRGKLISRNDTGGCSKVLDKCDYENEEYDIYNYCPKVSSKERGDSKHPTMKPISLITKILKLFMTPNQQVVYDPFTGTGSTGIACVTHERNFIGSEISEEYCKIAEKRIADAK